MPLEKKTLSFPLAKGMDEKPSAPSLGVDSLQAADNVRFEKTGQVRKRGGFVLTDSTQAYVTAGSGGSVGGSGSISTGGAIVQYKDETLIFDGSKVYSKITAPPTTNVLVDKGTFVPMTVQNEFKRRVADRRQGNAQITESNGIRVYMWAEYQFYSSLAQYQIRYDAEDIATGVLVQSNKLLASYAITVAASAANCLYEVPRPQCLAVSNRIFLLYQDTVNNKIKYRSIDCSTSTTVAQGETAEATLQDTSGGPGVDIALDATYPIFAVDVAGTQSLTNGGVLAYYTGSAFKVQYLEVDGATLKGTAVATVSVTASFSTYVKGTDTVLPSEIFVKTLDDSASATTAAIVFGCTVTAGGASKISITLLSDNLANQISYTDATTDAFPAASADMYLLAGTAGTAASGATDIYVPVTVIKKAEPGSTAKVPRHWSRVYKIALDTRTVASISSSSISVHKDTLSYCSTITSDAFRVGSSLYFAMSMVNDNLLAEDTSGSSRLRRGLSNTLAVLNHNGELIGATKMGQCATCIASEYVTLDPTQYAFVEGTSPQSNRRLWTGVQRVFKDASAGKYRFGASRFAAYINTSRDIASTGHNYDPDNVFGISMVTCDFAPSRTIASADADGSLILTGGVAHAYDGDRIFENDFVVSPSISQLVQSGTSESSYVAGGTVRGFPDGKVLKYSAVYEWGDSNGNVYRSAPAPFNEITINGGGVPKTITSHAQGTGYSAGVTHAVSGGAGTGLSIKVTAVGGSGEVTSFEFVDATPETRGTGYAVTNRVTLVGGGGNCQIDIDAVYNTNRVLVYVRPLPQALTRKGAISESYSLGGSTATPTGKGVNIIIYRTDDNGAQFYEIGSIPIFNGVGAGDEVALVDMPPDYANVINAEPMYTTDGEVESGCFGSCTDLVKHQNKVFAAGVDDNVYMSVPLTDGSAVRFPASYAEFQINFPGDSAKLTAIESNLDHLVIFTENNGFFVSGRGPDRLGFGPYGPPRLFASGQGAKAGAAHTDSPVGAFIQSDRGIYVIGRDMSVKYLGAQVEDKTSKLAVNMLRHDETNEVRIMLSNKGTASGSDEYLVYNYYFGQWSRYTVAYTSSAWQVGEVYDGTTFQRLTADGKQWAQSTAVFQDNSANYDMVIDTGFVSPTGILRKDRIYRFMYLGEYKGAHTAQANVYVDYQSGTTATPSIVLSGAPSDIFLYRTHMPSQKNRALRIKLVLTGSTECAYLNGLALEVGVRPEATNFKTSQARTF